MTHVNSIDSRKKGREGFIAKKRKGDHETRRKTRCGIQERVLTRKGSTRGEGRHF